MRRTFLLVPVVLAVALATPTTTTITRKVAAVALVSAKPDVPAHWREALQRVVTEDAERAWVSSPTATLDEARAALGCTTWDEACASQLTATTGAAIGIVVELAGAGAGITISVAEVRAGGSSERPTEKLALESRGADALELARQFVRAASRGRVAFVRVETDEVGATATLSGASLGPLPQRAAVIAGSHQIVVRKEGKAPLIKTITLAPGENPAVVLTLNAAGPSVAVGTTLGSGPTPIAGPGGAAAGPLHNATAGWTLTAVGGSALVLGAGLGLPWVLAFLDTDECGGQTCYPNPISVYGGLFTYADSDRQSFYTDFATASSAATAAVGIGALLLGTGLMFALAPEGSAEPPAGP